MASPATAGVALIFGGARIEVNPALASRRGGLRAFAREAEQSWSLNAHSYDFFDARGNKVDSYPAVQQALQATSDGICTFEVRERPEGTMLREALQTFQAQILTQVNAALSDVRREVDETTKKMNNCLAPMVQNIAMEQMDLRTKIDQMNDEALAARVDSLESFEELRTKLDQMNDEALATRTDSLESFQELINKTNSMCDEALEMRIDSLGSLEALESRIDSLETHTRNAIKDVVELDQELQQEFEAACDVDAAVEDDIEVLRAAVRGLDDDRAACISTAASSQQAVAKAVQLGVDAKQEAPSTPAFQLDNVAPAAKPAKQATRPSFLEDAWKPMPSASFGTMSYSAKTYQALSGFEYGNKLNAGGLLDHTAVSAPFAPPQNSFSSMRSLRGSVSVPRMCRQ
jgi:hypothetical protein